MTYKNAFVAISAVVLLAGATPALAQSRWEAQAAEARARREENKDVRTITEADKVTPAATTAPAAPVDTTTTAVAGK